MDLVLDREQRMVAAREVPRVLRVADPADAPGHHLVRELHEGQHRVEVRAREDHDGPRAEFLHTRMEQSPTGEERVVTLELLAVSRWLPRAVHLNQQVDADVLVLPDEPAEDLELDREVRLDGVLERFVGDAGERVFIAQSIVAQLDRSRSGIACNVDPWRRQATFVVAGR